MDPYSYIRRDEILEFERKAGIRSAIRKSYIWDDEYGCTADGHGFDYWYYQMKFAYRVRRRKRLSGFIEKVDSYRKSYKREMKDLFNAFNDDDDE